MIIPITITSLLLSFAINAQQVISGDKTQAIIEQGNKRLADNQQAQQSVNNIAEQRQQLKKQFVDELKLLDGLSMYNSMLDRQLATQQSEITKLNTSINNATLIERQVLPLLVRMVDAMESFLQLDIPFLEEERNNRVQGLRALLTESAITTSEKLAEAVDGSQ